MILAAGRGSRLDAGTPKAFLLIAGSSMVERSMRAAAACGAVDALVVATPPGMADQVEGVEVGVPVTSVVGGEARQDSVAACLRVLESDVVAVAVHDAARPFASPELFSAVLERVLAAGTGAVGDSEQVAGAIPAVPVIDTVKRVRDGVVIATEPRDELVLAQTPQAFRLDILRSAHERAATEGRAVTDDAAALEAIGARVATVPGEGHNVKITTREDLERAEAWLSAGGVLR